MAKFDRNSDTYKQAKAILGRDSGSLTDKSTSSTAKFPGELDSIDIQPAENGVSITHRTKPKKTVGSKGEVQMDDYDSRRHTHVFDNAHAAHAHIGKLLGVGGDQ